MPKRRPCEEIFKDGSREIRMVGDFGFLVAVNESSGRDVSVIYSELTSGLMPPEDIRNVLANAAVLADDVDRYAFVEDLINRYGLQECAIMARVMLSHAMIGDVKKSAIEQGDVLRGLVNLEAGASRWRSFLRLGLLWAVSMIVSTALACTIFSLYVMPT